MVAQIVPTRASRGGSRRYRSAVTDDPNRPDPTGEDPTEPLIVPASDLPMTQPTGLDGNAEAPPTEVMPAQDPPVGAVPVSTDPDAAIPGQPPKWYENRNTVAAIIAVGLIGLFLLIAWLIWWSDDDDQGLVADSTTTTIVVETTLPETSLVEVEPLPTVETTVPESTTTSTTTTSTTTTTTVPPTTAATTTTIAPATTVATTAAPATTVPATTTVPVVTVPPGPAATVLDIIQASPDLSRLNQLIIDAGIADELDGDGPITMFAPSNPAIETLEAAPGGAALLADPDQLRDLLLRHVVPLELNAANVFTGGDLTTLNGDVLVVDGAAETIDGASLLVVDVESANGFLHVVDQVLIDRSG